MTIKLTFWRDVNENTYCININDGAMPDVEFKKLDEASNWINGFMRACELTGTTVQATYNL